MLKISEITRIAENLFGFGGIKIIYLLRFLLLGKRVGVCH